MISVCACTSGCYILGVEWCGWCNCKYSVWIVKSSLRSRSYKKIPQKLDIGCNNNRVSKIGRWTPQRNKTKTKVERNVCWFLDCSKPFLDCPLGQRTSVWLVKPTQAWVRWRSSELVNDLGLHWWRTSDWNT